MLTFTKEQLSEVMCKHAEKALQGKPLRWNTLRASRPRILG